MFRSKVRYTNKVALSSRDGGRWLLSLSLVAVVACGDDQGPTPDDHGPIAEGIMAPLGEPLPSATAEQLATFERGLAVAERRFTFDDGLGPVFNVSFCGSCHEKPAIGGSSGLYRNFFLAGVQVEGGGFFAANEVSLFDCGTVDTPPDERERMPPPESNSGVINGVVRQFGYVDGGRARPDLEAQVTHTAQRNAIPFFGVGLLAELTSEEIESRADPDDLDGDGISGRVNKPGGFVGRFGTKSQTADIEGFIRGPIFNHAGITTDPLTDEQRSRLPVDSSSASTSAARQLGAWLRNHAQAAAPGSPNCDLDDVQDPEMAPSDLFDLVSFAMLLAAPPVEELNEQTMRGLKAFDSARCGDCHTPRLNAPRGPIPVYSDLLLHDMGPDLDDGISFMADAESSEFRTQPLWGISATGPYLHDGRGHHAGRGDPGPRGRGRDLARSVRNPPGSQSARI